MSLRRIERELRAALTETGHAELAARALHRVDFTDDGGTIYVHVFAKPTWSAVSFGDVLVLAHADYPDLRTCSQWRGFMEDARLYLHDEFPRVVRWLQGKG